MDKEQKKKQIYKLVDDLFVHWVGITEEYNVDTVEELEQHSEESQKILNILKEIKKR